MAWKKGQSGNPGGRKEEFNTGTIAKIDENVLAQARDYTISEALGIDDKTFKSIFPKAVGKKEPKVKAIENTA